MRERDEKRETRRERREERDKRKKGLEGKDDGKKKRFLFPIGDPQYIDRFIIQFSEVSLRLL